MKSNNQIESKVNQIKNQLLDIAIISIMLMILPMVLHTVYPHQGFQLICFTHCIAFLCYLILVILSKRLTYGFRLFAVTVILIIVGITALFDYLYLDCPLPQKVALGIILSGIFTYGLKKILSEYVSSIHIIDQQTQDLSDSQYRLSISEIQYNNLFNNMLDAFAVHEIIVDKNNQAKDYRFLIVNPAFEAMTGLKSKDVIGKTVTEVLPENESYWIEIYGKVALTGEPARFENYSKELDRYFEVCSYCPKPGHFACIFQDITHHKKAESEQKELESQLRQAHKMEALGTLAGGMAHDFNNMLMPIMGYTEMLIEDYADNEETSSSLKEILKAATRAKKLAEQVLTFSRRSKIQFKPVDINSVIDETIPLLETSIPYHIHLRPDIEHKSHIIMGDSVQLQQIIMNLCINAAHAIDKDSGLITISLCEQKQVTPFLWNGKRLSSGGYHILTIADNGPGIAPEIQERIFDPYFTTKPKGKGTGLGLSMVLGIVNRLKGGIYLATDSVNGTRFDIYLPAFDADKKEVPE